MSCGVGRRCCSDLALLWLWCSPAATAPIRPLAWEPPHAVGMAQKRQKTKKKKKKKKKRKKKKKNLKTYLIFIQSGTKIKRKISAEASQPKACTLAGLELEFIPPSDQKTF